ncbi:MAG TPA: SPFH domain-containing protein [Dehalococcoidia bacterium]|nr:SPFH domain-containing protein [Dehalococcoidia bacterium]
MALFFKIVPEYQRLVRFTLGRYDGAPRGPGWVWIVPIVHLTRTVDLREDVVELKPQTCITKDNAPVTVDMIVFMRVINPEDSVMKVQDYRYAAESIAVTTLRSVVGDLILDDVLAKREQINHVMQEKLDEVTERWGVKVNAVEIREILPPRDIQEAMSRQMSAERNRRAVVLEADGTREAAVMIADGNREAAILSAEGQKQAAILGAEGNRQAAILNAEGFALALQRIYETASGIDEKTLSLQYLDMMKALANGPSTKWVIPMELTTFVQGFARNMAVAAVPRATANGGSASNGGAAEPPAGAADESA